MAKRLNRTALAKRRYDAAQMNLAGMTLAQIGEKLGVDPATVCRDLAWVRQEWRKGAVENFDQARAMELAKLNHLEKCCWEAWERSKQDKVTRIEVRSTPDGGSTWEKQETQAGKSSLLDEAFKYINKRSKLLEPGRPKEEKTVAMGNGQRSAFSGQLSAISFQRSAVSFQRSGDKAEPCPTGGASGILGGASGILGRVGGTLW